MTVPLAIVGGIIFGALHLGAYNYLESIAKGIAYAMVIIFVLPHGLITVIAGHLLLDVAAIAALKGIHWWATQRKG